MTVAIEDENPQHNNCTFGRWREVNKVTKEDKKGWAIDSDRISVEESAPDCAIGFVARFQG
jgi:hypothetical protein